MSEIKNDNFLIEGQIHAYDYTVTLADYFVSCAKAKGLSSFIGDNTMTKANIISTVASVTKTVCDADTMSNYEIAGRLRVDAVRLFAIVTGTSALTELGIGVAGSLVANELTKEQYEEIGRNVFAEINEKIKEQTGDLTDNYFGDELGEETALLSSIDWNAVGEGLTSFFQAQVEMEMEFEGYLPKNIDTTNVYAKGITSQCDPIVLDLNGDGVTTTYVKENYVNFDLDANGFAERTGWINAQDGFLVRDINGNGKIDDGAEMFGDHTMLQNGKTASNGYEALKELDTNYDGKIDSKDTAYNELKIWKDSNSNGVTDNGELFTLAELGIESINTNYTYKNTKDENTNTVYGTGTYTKTDGTTGKTADLFFDVDKVNTTADESDVMYSEEILDLPDLKGYGTTHGLHYAMAKDGTGELTSLVKQYVDSTDVREKDTLLDQIIYKWTGADAVSTTKYGSYIDGRKMAALEAIYGQNWTFSIL